MLHTNFRGYRSVGSGEEFEGFLPYMDMDLVKNGQVVSEKSLF